MNLSIGFCLNPKQVLIWSHLISFAHQLMWKLTISCVFDSQTTATVDARLWSLKHVRWSISPRKKSEQLAPEKTKMLKTIVAFWVCWFVQSLRGWLIQGKQNHEQDFTQPPLKHQEAAYLPYMGMGFRRYSPAAMSWQASWGVGLPVSVLSQLKDGVIYDDENEDNKKTGSWSQKINFQHDLWLNPNSFKRSMDFWVQARYITWSSDPCIMPSCHTPRPPSCCQLPP